MKRSSGGRTVSEVNSLSHRPSSRSSPSTLNLLETEIERLEVPKGSRVQPTLLSDRWNGSTSGEAAPFAAVS